MIGETNLQKLVQAMSPKLCEGVYVFCTMTDEAASLISVKPLMSFREEEGVTLILTREEAERAGLSFQTPSRMITMMVHSSLEAVGFLAVITKYLVEKSISVNVVSAFYHDHLFVPDSRAADAMAVLGALAKK